MRLMFFSGDLVLYAIIACKITGCHVTWQVENKISGEVFRAHKNNSYS